jgi:hypothetical protein
MPQGPNILLLGTKLKKLKIKGFHGHIKKLAHSGLFLEFFSFIAINKVCYTCCYKEKGYLFHFVVKWKRGGGGGGSRTLKDSSLECPRRSCI